MNIIYLFHVVHFIFMNVHKVVWNITNVLIYHHRINTPRKQGGLGHMKVPLVADSLRSISRDYGVLKEDEGIAYRYGWNI